jgi:phosphatidylserine/phosphatidylglycerophosphate/cardiolipin synthase-like enzyme
VGGLFVSTRAAGIHAKLISCDLRWAVVTSCNVLNASPDRKELEIGILVQEPAGGSTSGPALPASGNALWSAADDRPTAALALSGVLDWIRGIMPDFRFRPVLVSDPALDGRRLASPALEVGGEVAPPGNIGIWQGTFERRAKELDERRKKLGALAHVVTDGQHRELLHTALRTARVRIAISSRDLGAGLLGQATWELVLEAVRRGVEVEVFHARRAEWSGDLDTRKQALAAAGVVFHERNVHAKILVCDDWAIVSSYNFLSMLGYYDAQHRTRHELGVRVLAMEVADQLVRLLRQSSIQS